jgi:hypothetical protein
VLKPAQNLLKASNQQRRKPMIRRYLLLGGLCGALLLGGTAPLSAGEAVIFNSIPSPLPANVASEGPEAYAFREMGDAIVFPAGTGGTLTRGTVVMSSWACTSGSWFTPGTCVTKKDAKFAQPITMNIYKVDDTNPARPNAGALLGTVKQTFQIPYRPSSDTVHCPSGEQWYNPDDGLCYHGIAAPITFDFSKQKILLPSQIVVGIAYNTTTAGPTPVGPSACSATTQGCPYDSLNISTDGSVFFAASPGATSGGSPTAASVIDPNGIFFNYYVNTGCHTATPGTLEDDTLPANGEPTTEACFTGYHPELIIRAKCGADGEPRCPAVIGGQGVQLKGDND